MQSYKANCCRPRQCRSALPNPSNRRVIGKWERLSGSSSRLSDGSYYVSFGHNEDRGGRSAVCELLDWTGESLPSLSEIGRLPLRRETGPRGISQFLFQEPRTKRDRTRILRTGMISTPAQKCGAYSGFIWPYVDRQFRERCLNSSNVRRSCRTLDSAERAQQSSNQSNLRRAPADRVVRR